MQYRQFKILIHVSYKIKYRNVLKSIFVVETLTPLTPWVKCSIVEFLGVLFLEIFSIQNTISCCSILSQGTKNTCRSCDVILLMTPCSILPCPSSFLVLHMWAGLPVVVVSWRISTYGISTTGHYCVKSYISSQWVKRKSPSN